MTIKTFTFNPFQTNCFVCHHDGEAVLVDPACQQPQETEAVEAYLEAHTLTVRHLLLTHAHIDHIFGCAHFAERYGQGFQMHRGDMPLLARARDQADFFGVALEAPPPPEGFLDEGDELDFGGVVWRVLHTPGHSPGSISFHDVDGGYALVGDVLFSGSIGRTDLPGGSLPQLMQVIFEKLLPLGDDVRVYPGHGVPTTIGHERHTNPFLQPQ